MKGWQTKCRVAAMAVKVGMYYGMAETKAIRVYMYFKVLLETGVGKGSYDIPGTCLSNSS